ncbi:hypothetical protein ANANG_G00075630 [Anguilla anguilla]|uniref:Uncharacterized protein n=1 Tax=Anguilla anguilla TaxID=7936 RepID=A0A9D3S094_ANGAN|nr:hypothetical protein ANANG_G00075630 [Anguilla anguilla]
MEDREALKRQIELLQNLINTHRSVHGDVPSHVGERRPLVAAPSRGRGLAAQTSASFRAPPGRTAPPRRSLEKKYSLSNKSPASTARPPPITPLHPLRVPLATRAPPPPPQFPPVTPLHPLWDPLATGAPPPPPSPLQSHRSILSGIP